LQKPIEDIEFRRWNEKQREFAREDLKRDFEELWKSYKALNPIRREHPRLKLSEEDKKQKCKEHYQKNRNRILQQNRLWVQKNKEKLSEHKKQYYQQNKDKIISKRKEYYLNNKEKVKERMKLWWANNRDATRIAKREYYVRFKKRINAKARIRYGLRKAFALQTPENDTYKPYNPDSPSQMAEFYFNNYF